MLPFWWNFAWLFAIFLLSWAKARCTEQFEVKKDSIFRIPHLVTNLLNKTTWYELIVFNADPDLMT